MKVENTGKAQQAGKAKKKDSISGDGSFGDMVAGRAAETKETSATQSIAHVDALLAVQAVEDPTQKATRNRMCKRADHLLDELDQIRMGLLCGTLTVGDVINVADVVASHREKVTDPELTAILDEIDLRAQIEIAKMRVALDNH